MKQMNEQANELKDTLDNLREDRSGLCHFPAAGALGLIISLTRENTSTGLPASWSRCNPYRVEYAYKGFGRVLGK